MAKDKTTRHIFSAVKGTDVPVGTTVAAVCGKTVTKTSDDERPFCSRCVEAQLNEYNKLTDLYNNLVEFMMRITQDIESTSKKHAELKGM